MESIEEVAGEQWREHFQYARGDSILRTPAELPVSQASQASEASRRHMAGLSKVDNSEARQDQETHDQIADPQAVLVYQDDGSSLVEQGVHQHSEQAVPEKEFAIHGPLEEEVAHHH